MRALTRKLWRDLWQMRGPALAIMMVVAAGVAVFVASRSTLDSLELTRASCYDEYRFAHVFARVTRAPESIGRRAAELPGVVQVQTRVVTDVTLALDGVAEPLTGRLISIPERRGPMLNDLHLREGRYIEPGRDDEVLLSEAFAEKRRLRPGAEVEVVVNGRKRRLHVVGLALSPEYVYQISGSSPWPDDERFAVMWMGSEALRAALDMRGAFNDLTLTLSHGASEGDVIAALDRMLAPYGGLSAHGRDRQISDQFVSDEFRQLRSSGNIVPSLFLAVAAFLMNVVVSRVISTQRTQIATLKAFGYSNWAIGQHYLEMALVLVLAGAAVGVGVGLWLGGGMTQLYAAYYRFPALRLRITAGTAALGVVISVAAATIGVAFAVMRAARLPPAEAMRPEAPASYKPTLVERLGLGRLMSPAARMILRNVSRRPLRALLAASGVALAVAIVVVGRFTENAGQYMADLQFRLVQGEDAAVFFYQAVPRAAAAELASVPGVLRVEPLRAAPVTLRVGHREHRTAIVGLTAGSAGPAGHAPGPPAGAGGSAGPAGHAPRSTTPDALLHRTVDRHGAFVPIPDEGLVLGAYLARKLGVRPGDVVTVEVLEGRRPVREVPVAALIDDLVGASATMSLDALNRLLGEGDSISGAYLAVDRLGEEAVYEQLKRTPLVAGVSTTRAALESFDKIMGENLGRMRTMQLIFSSIIAFAVVYNKARIALAERSRELASLRVLGFTRAEVSLILLGELAVTTLAGIPLGMGLGYCFAWGLCQAYEDTEMFRFPLIIYPSTYAYAALVVLVSAAFSALVVRRRIDQLDLVSVLKTRD
ncbi:FtsX-like permease family protein [Sorangium sp. So ce260]|uniref:ABC transporter permease n=1 Tax=Sorangium sp. So ce260 TaxID=3133291 RepID=UPI003F6482C0